MGEIIYDIKPSKVASAYVKAPFDEGKETLEKNGFKIISLEQNARLRIQECKDISFLEHENYVMEGVIYVRGKGKILTKKSPIMENAVLAVKRHREGGKFYLSKEQVEKALADSVTISKTSIPTNRFGENEITNYAFGNIAKDYGLFLKDKGIKKMPIALSNLEDRSFAKQVWFCGTNYKSSLSTIGDGLSCGNRVRGIYEIESYSREQIKKALYEVGSPELRGSLLNKLRNI